MFGAYVRENRKVVIALAVYTAVFGFIFWLYRLPLGAVRYAALVCLFLLLVWFAVDYRRFAARLRLLRRLEQEITLSTEQLPEPDGALEAQYQALVRALDADRRAQLTRSQQGYQDLVEYYTVWAHQIKTPIAAMRLLLQDADTDEQRALIEQLQSVEQYVEMVLGIAPEDLPRVFEKGYTGSNGRTDKRATGIGLYLCRRILAKLGHSITIVSTPGAGTTVRIGLEQDALEVE